MALLTTLASIADKVYAIIECSTPKTACDDSILQEYFSRMRRAEQSIFSQPQSLPNNIQALSIPMGEASQLSLNQLQQILSSDSLIIFGASYLQGKLAERLIEQQAINLHMGISPYYRGAACNFWALYDGNPQWVGATIHRLNTGLDNGDILYHALPAVQAIDPFSYAMLAVKSAQQSLLPHLINNTLQTLQPIKQDNTQQLRYARKDDFNASIAQNYLDKLLMPSQLQQALSQRCLEDFIQPVVIAS